jgi:hypothetical protein
MSGFPSPANALPSLFAPPVAALQLAKQQQDKAADAAAKKKRGEAAKAKAADAARAKAVAAADGAEHSGEMDGRMLSALITGAWHAAPAVACCARCACCPCYSVLCLLGLGRPFVYLVCAELPVSAHLGHPLLLTECISATKLAWLQVCAVPSLMCPLTRWSRSSRRTQVGRHAALGWRLVLASRAPSAARFSACHSLLLPSHAPFPSHPLTMSLPAISPWVSSDCSLTFLLTFP